MKLIFGVILALCYSSAVHSEDLGGFVNKMLAGDPLKEWDVDEPKGRVKKLTTYRMCDGACDNPQVDMIFFFDSDKRVYKLVQDNGETETVYRYSENSMFPIKEERSSYGQKYTIFYGRDKYGNKTSIDGRPLQIKRKGKGYETYNDGRSIGLGEVWRYYEDGLLIRETSLGAEAFISKAPIKKTEDIYEYEYHENGVIFKKKRTTLVNGNPMRVSIDYFSDMGLLTHRWMSDWGDPDSGLGQQWIDYSFDNFGNWISRKRCKVSSGWDKFDTCHFDKRSIEYH